MGPFLASPKAAFDCDVPVGRGPAGCRNDDAVTFMALALDASSVGYVPSGGKVPDEVSLRLLMLSMLFFLRPKLDRLSVDLLTPVCGRSLSSGLKNPLALALTLP